MKNVSKGAACLPSATALVVATPNPAPADSTHIATGPVTSWSYGYIAADAGAFSLLEGGHTYHGMPAWSRTPRYPIIAFNNSLNDDPEGLGVGNFRVPRNRILLVPGRTGEFATVRWTAPANGRYPVEGLFDGLDTCVSSHVRITKDGVATPLFTSTVTGAPSGRPSPSRSRCTPTRRSTSAPTTAPTATSTATSSASRR